MVIHVFPAAKLTGVLLRQISRPIANSVKDYAKNHPHFRKYFCMPPAYIYNWCEVKVKMWTFRTGKPVKIPPLNDAMAIELGASILGELVIFITAAIVVSFEYIRQSRKEERKEQLRLEELDKLHSKIQNLKTLVTQQEEQIADLYNTVRQLERKSPINLRSYSSESESHTDAPRRESSVPHSVPFFNSATNNSANESSDAEAKLPSSANPNKSSSRTSLQTFKTDDSPGSSEDKNFSVHRDTKEAHTLGIVSNALTHVLNGIFFGQYESYIDLERERDTNSEE